MPEKKKTHKLTGESTTPFTLIALSSADNQIKVAWNINKQLKLNLRETNSPIVKEDGAATYPIFSDKDTLPNLSFNLIANKAAKSFLLKDLSNVDYIIEIVGIISPENKINFIRQLKQVPAVVAAIEIDPAKLKLKTALSDYK